MKIRKGYMAIVMLILLLMGSFITETAFAQGEAAVMVKVGGREYEAVFFDNQTAGGLLSKMPFQLNMSELNGNEKYRYLDYSLPRNEEAVEQIQAGDIMLYGSDCLVLFYKSFQTSYKYTRVGRLTNPEGLADAAGSGKVMVSFSAVQNQNTTPIRLTKERLTLRKGQKKTIKLSGAVAKKVKWSSSNKKVATVSGGKITAKKAGSAVITAKYKGRKYKCKVTVKSAKKNEG